MSNSVTRTSGFSNPHIERFRAAWESGQPVAIDSSLPPDDAPEYLATLEEFVCIEMEHAWRRWAAEVTGASSTQVAEAVEFPASIESYVERYPRLDRPDVLRRLIAHECFLRQQAGDPASLGEYQERFPALHVTQREFQSALGTLGYQFDAAALADVLETKIGVVGGNVALPQSFGNYELMEELGRGGMGVVFRARQRTADRIVALKVIRRDRLESMPRDSQTTAIDRFRHEAQAAARLEHDHIVRVYEVGEFEGHQFYSMRCVEGCSLADLLRQGPIDGRRAAIYLEPIARAVHEAHQHGILHRDLKPQNILLDRKTERTLVTDFGLAKLTEGEEELTRAGEIMGTPPYMSPEQARDSAGVTISTDVYALGATLYHLITGRPPFQAATGVETLRQVLDDDPAPPRQLNPAIDVDLETITLKCLQKEPARRYESANALADELQRYINGEPITARPVSQLERFTRWRRRNPVTAGLVGSTAGFLVLALVATVVGLVSVNYQRNKAERRLAKAREAVDKLFIEAAENDLLNQPGVQPVRRKLLTEALTYYEWFLNDAPDDPELADELARTHFRVGRITEWTESPSAAQPHYQRALAMQEQLLADDPDDVALLADLGDTHNYLAQALIQQNDLESAREHFTAAVEARRKRSERAPHDAEAARLLANATMNLGTLEQRVGNFDEAVRLNEAAQDIRRTALDGANGATRTLLQHDLGKGSFNLVQCAQDEWAALDSASEATDADSPEQVVLRERARRHQADAVEMFRSVSEADPADLQLREQLARVLLGLANLNAEAGELTLAEDNYAETLQRFRQLADDNPSVPQYREGLGQAYLELGMMRFQNDDNDGAAEAFLAALHEFQPLSEQYGAPNDRFNEARALLMLGGARERLGDLQEAKRSMASALVILDELAEAYPDAAMYVFERDVAADQLGRLNDVSE